MVSMEEGCDPIRDYYRNVPHRFQDVGDKTIQSLSAFLDAICCHCPTANIFLIQLCLSLSL